MRSDRLPPGPRLGPFATIRAFQRDPIGLLERAAAFGDVARLRTPRHPTILLNHPDLVWDVLVTDHRSFHKGPTIQAARRVLGDGLLTSEGDHHRRQRRLIQPLFQTSRLDAYVPAMLEVTERASASWRDGDLMDVHAEMSRLTLAIVVATLFGSDLRDTEARAAFLPFGAGPRMCVGEPFARLEAVLVLATIARAWRFEPLSDDEPRLQPVITLRPRDGLPMRANARR